MIIGTASNTSLDSNSNMNDVSMNHEEALNDNMEEIKLHITEDLNQPTNKTEIPCNVILTKIVSPEEDLAPTKTADELLENMILSVEDDHDQLDIARALSEKKDTNSSNSLEFTHDDLIVSDPNIESKEKGIREKVKYSNITDLCLTNNETYPNPINENTLSEENFTFKDTLDTGDKEASTNEKQNDILNELNLSNKDPKDENIESKDHTASNDQDTKDSSKAVTELVIAGDENIIEDSVVSSILK